MSTSFNAQGRKRDEKVIEIGEQGPFTLRHLLHLGLFPSKQTASRRLWKLKGKLYQVGKLHLDALFDNKEEYWCRRNIKRDNLLHEAYTMEVVLAYYPCVFMMGADVNQTMLPDATLTIGGNTYHVELDCDTMGRGQMSKRMLKYAGCTDTVLVVCLTESRMKRLMKWWSPLPNAYFSTIRQVVSDPYGPVWTGSDGQIASVEKAVEQLV